MPMNSDSALSSSCSSLGRRVRSVYFLPFSALHTYVEDIFLPFNCSNTQKDSYSDLALCTKGWSRYTFFHILSGQGQNILVVKRSTAEIHHIRVNLRSSPVF